MLIIPKLLKQVALSLVALFSLASCRTAYHFEALTPAYYTLPQNIDSVLVVNTCPPTLWTDTSAYDKKSAAIIAHAEKHMPMMLGTMMSNFLNQESFLPSKIYPKTISFEELKDTAFYLCRNNNANALLVLKDMDYKVKSTAKKKESGLPRWMEPIYNLSDIAYIKASWVLMFPSGASKNFEIISDSIVLDIDCNYSDIELLIPAPRERIFYAASRVCDVFTSQITPYWRTCNREIFFSHKNKFTDAMIAIESNKWEDAKKILHEIYLNDNKKNKIRAALDLSLAYEREDDIDASLIWLFKAQELLDNKHRFIKHEKEYAKNLLPLLLKRKEEIKKLDKQMNKI